MTHKILTALLLLANKNTIFIKEKSRMEQWHIVIRILGQKEKIFSMLKRDV
jgi:hypothetical protein